MVSVCLICSLVVVNIPHGNPWTARLGWLGWVGVVLGPPAGWEIERTVQTVKDYVIAHDYSPFFVLLRFLASLAELISEMRLRVFKYKWNMF